MAGKSNHYDSMVALQTMIAGLQLQGLSSAPVIQEVPDFKSPDLVTPCILIAPWGTESYDAETETNAQDSPIYPTVITIVADPDDLAITFETRLAWRQAIRRRLRNASLSAVDPTLVQNYQLECKPFPIVDPKAWFGPRKYVSGFLVNIYFQEPRT